MKEMKEYFINERVDEHFLQTSVKMQLLKMKLTKPTYMSHVSTYNDPL